MALKDRVHVKRLRTERDRAAGIQVLKVTYREEKHWVADVEKMFLREDLANGNISWFASYLDDEPIGVVRVMYEPPLELYRQYGFKQIDNGSFNIDEFIKAHKIAEIGRFAVLPDYRKYSVFAGLLMAAASEETVKRGFSHYVTDVFEGEKHSPYDFHTRVMGFKPVATHDVGELNCPNRRITMILDLKECYHRLKKSKQSAFRMITGGWSRELHERMLRD